MASPLPMGFFAFGVGSFLFTLTELGWLAQTQLRPTAVVLIGFVAPLELIAAVIAFWARDAGGATALGILGLTWASVAGLILTNPPGTIPLLGAFLLAISVIVAALAVAAIMGKPVFSVVLGLAAVRFICTGVFQLTGSVVWERASGWLGLPLCAAAVYLGLALILEDLNRGTVLPLLRRGRARTSVESHLGQQVADIEREAGVRGQL